MKKTLLIISLTLLSVNLYSQEQELNTQKLTYHKEIPVIDSYTVIKNTSGISEIPIEILEEINFYRKLDDDFKWVVNDQIEILIYPINKKKKTND